MADKQALLRKARLLQLFARHPVAGRLPGEWPSVFTGPGYEFWDLRPFMPGDSPRHIDWKARARTGGYYVRQYLADAVFHLMILYDVSPSMGFGTKARFCAHIAASLAYTAAAAQIPCGLICFADSVKTYLPPRSGWTQLERIGAVLAGSKLAASPHTDLNAALDRLVAEGPESLCFILSDFYYLHEQDLAYRFGPHSPHPCHAIKALEVSEPWERQLPPHSQGLIELRDPESGAKRLLDLGRWREYNRQMAIKSRAIREKLEKKGIDLLILKTDEDFAIPIQQFMAGR